MAALAFSAILAAPASAADAPAAPAAEETAPGGIGLRLVDAPVSAKDDPRARVYIVDHLAPGATIERRVEVSNTTDSEQQVALYPSAASIDDGSFVGAAEDTPNELSTWTSLDIEQADVPAGGSVMATVTIAVPADAAPGEQYGVVWAEARSAPEAEGGVTQVSRVGIRLYVSVGPGGAPAADFTVDSLSAGRTPEGAPTVLATVTNTGGRAIDMNGTLELTNGPGGLSAGPFPASPGKTLALDDTQPVTVVLDDELPAGPWDAKITLASGMVERTAEATITFPDAGTAAPVDTTPASSTPAWLIPAIAGAGVVVVGAGTAGALHLRGRRRRRLTPRPL